MATAPKGLETAFEKVTAAMSVVDRAIKTITHPWPDEAEIVDRLDKTCRQCGCDKTHSSHDG